MVQGPSSGFRARRGATYLRSAIAAALTAIALVSADKIVRAAGATPIALFLMLVPALVIALAIEVIVNERAATAYTWRSFRSEAAGSVIGVLVVLLAAMRIGEPVFANPWPWLVMACAVVPFAVAIGYARSRLLASKPTETP